MDELISRQAAIEAISEYGFVWMHVSELARRIEQLPSAQPEPCEDAVSRKAVIDTIDEWKEACAGSGHKETVSDIKLIRKDFIDLPSVTPKQRTGGWIKGWYTNGNCYHRCNQCFAEIEDIFFGNDYEVNFCPNCGTKMEGDVS